MRPCRLTHAIALDQREAYAQKVVQGLFGDGRGRAQNRAHLFQAHLLVELVENERLGERVSERALGLVAMETVDMVVVADRARPFKHSELDAREPVVK